MKEIRVAVVQMNPRLAEVSENLVQMSNFVEKICSEQKVDLVVFPELVTTGYECGVRFTDLAERVPGPTANLLAQRAAEFNTHIAFGMVAKEKVESILYNAAILIGPDGELIGQYRKVHLRGEERLAFRPGYRYPVLEAGFGQVGFLISWDLAFPEVARSLALDGAELLIVCATGLSRMRRSGEPMCWPGRMRTRFSWSPPIGWGRNTLTRSLATAWSWARGVSCMPPLRRGWKATP